MSLLAATFFITAMMKAGRSAGPGIWPLDTGNKLLTTMEPMNKHKEKQLKQGFPSLMVENPPPLPSSKQQQAILCKEQSNHNHHTVQPGKQDLKEQIMEKDVKMNKDVGSGAYLCR